MKARNSTLWKERIGKCTRKTVLLLLVPVLLDTAAMAQCPAGYSEAKLVWDYLDYYPFNGTYSANSFLANNTQARTQHFAFGTQRLTIIHGYADANSLGENGTHTGSAGSFGNGDDIQFIGNSPGGGAITFTFDNDVENLRFSIYDIDRGQRVQFAASGGTPVTARTINLAKVSGTLLTVSNNNTTNARVDAAAGVNAMNTSTDGTINVTIAGPVKTVTITVSNTSTSGSEDGSFWISDITACSAGTMPVNYYNIVKPFTGQPGYVLHAFNKDVYYVDPATGFTRFLFTDATGPGNVNSLAYDPYNKIIYYVYSLTAAGNSKVLKKYDVNTGVISTALADLNTIGVRTSSTTGSESGAAAFYNGSYYIGIENGNGSRTSNREATIWRIDFDALGVPFQSSQVFAVPIDDGAGLLLHDWSDFVIYDGILYNFDAAENDRNAVAVANRNQSDIYHVDLMSRSVVNFTRPGAASVPVWYPGQPAIDWQGNIVQVYANGAPPNTPQGMPFANPYVTNYDGAGGIGAPINMFSTPMFTPAVPSLGDAAEAFKPRSDFGDAPSSYDPDPDAPATHELVPNLRIGSTVANEWGLTSSALADAEGGEEDGIGAAPALNYDATLTYSITVSVFNNTGANATLAGWLDYNFNGVFDPGEGVTITVPSSASPQMIPVSWNNIWVQTTTNLRTFLRLRLTSASNGMTAATGMTGWFADGEVEDFEVILGVALPKDINSFNLVKQANASVDVKWNINVQQPVNSFDILRSTDNTNWKNIGTIKATGGFGLQNYIYNDGTVNAGTAYYRIQINYQANGASKVTEVKSVHFDNRNTPVKILPNPAVNYAEIQVTAAAKDYASIQVYDHFGRTLLNLHKPVEQGVNTIRVDNLRAFASGTYTVRVTVNGKVTTSKLVINKQ